jgi:hypothetical protein
MAFPELLITPFSDLQAFDQQVNAEYHLMVNLDAALRNKPKPTMLQPSAGEGGSEQQGLVPRVCVACGCMGVGVWVWVCVCVWGGGGRGVWNVCAWVGGVAGVGVVLEGYATGKAQT